MANEVNFRAPTGVTCYFHVMNASGQVWSTVGSAFDNPATWANYDTAATEFSTTQYFSGTFPTIAGSPTVSYIIIPYIQGGASPVSTDVALDSFEYHVVDGTNVDHATEWDTIQTQTDLLPASPAAVGSAMTLDLTQAVPTSNTAETVGDSFNAARSQGFGKWVISGTTLIVYASDGTTAVRTFTLAPSGTAPTSRT